MRRRAAADVSSYLQPGDLPGSCGNSFILQKATKGRKPLRRGAEDFVRFVSCCKLPCRRGAVSGSGHAFFAQGEAEFLHESLGVFRRRAGMSRRSQAYDHPEKLNRTRSMDVTEERSAEHACTPQ